MKKAAFRQMEIDVEGKKQSIWILETPTFLKRLLSLEIIDKETYDEKLKRYYDAIEKKETKIKSNDELRDYQTQNIEYAKEFNSFAIFDEPRLGKTPTMIRLLKEKKLLEEKIIVMCPSNVIQNWIKAFKIWGGVEAKKFEGEFESNILIMTYKRTSMSLKELIKWKPTVAILDEAHVLRNSKGKRQKTKYTKKQKEEKEYIDELKNKKLNGDYLTEEEERRIKEYEPPISNNKAILKIAKEAKNRYALSGTPNVNKPQDIFPILTFILPQFFDSYWTFVYYFFKVSITHWGNREIRDFKNEQRKAQMVELLNYISSRNTQKEKMPWLKQPSIITTYLPLSNEQKKLRSDLIDHAKLGNDFILDALETMVHEQTICISPLIFKELETNDLGTKGEYILDYIMDNPEKNIAIFSVRKEFLKIMEEKIKQEFPSRTIYTIKNSKNSEKIQSIINIKSKKRGIIFLGTVGKSKEGISLVGLNKAFITDQPWIPTDIQQLIHRLDATTPEEQDFFGEKEFEILQHKDTIDTTVQEVLDGKISRTKVINNYKEFIEKRRKE